MTERPILFSGPMVRALLAGRKTQTRRILKPQPRGDVASLSHIGTFVKTGRALFAARDAARQPVSAFPIGDHSVKDDIACPYGAAGDQLWVRETHAGDNGCVWAYRADHPNADIRAGDLDDGEQSLRRWTPAIHMKREACRLLLDLTDVRVERLQAISQADAKAEGVTPLTIADGGFVPTSGADYAGAYRLLWDDLNAARGFGWNANPWVWVVTFRTAA